MFKKSKYDICSSLDEVKVENKVFSVPKKYLNPFGFINYDYYGRKPWNSCDEEKEDIFLPLYIFNATNILGIHCEMVEVALSKITLGRISIVNAFGYCIYDTFVKPQETVTDYRRKETGISCTDLANGEDEEIVLKRVAEIVDGKTLVGHSFHNALYALGLSNHPMNLIRDTAVYYKRELEMREGTQLPLADLIEMKFKSVPVEPCSVRNAQAVLKLYLMSRDKWEEDIIKRVADKEYKRLNKLIYYVQNSSRENAKLTFDPKSGSFAIDISEMHVAPTEADLFADSKKVFLRKNKVVGAYSSCSEYLDVQFRLLQEDFLIPLRESVKSVQERRQSKDSLFQGVTILGNSKVKGPTVIMIPIEGNNLQDLDSRESKIFMNGSLLLLTPDNFKTVKMATVLFRPKKNATKRGSCSVQLRVKFCDDGPSWSHNNSRFIMMESPAFYDAYKNSLEYLRKMYLHLFPMKKYIVDAVTETQPPLYLESVTEKLDFSVVMKNSQGDPKSSKKCYKASPLDLKNWPTAEELNLDSSQYEAFQKAITQELTIIQGPPGTGKTFIGIQIVKLLLSNPWLLDSPILIVSYTNHALDQTLEYILNFATNELCDGDARKAEQMILRIGGGTKSQSVIPLTLSYKVEKNAERFEQMEQLESLERILCSVKGLNFDDLLLEQGILDIGRLPKDIQLKLQLSRNSSVAFEQWKIIEKQMRQDPVNWFGLKTQTKAEKINLADLQTGLFAIPFNQKYRPELHPDIVTMRDKILSGKILSSTFDNISLEHNCSDRGPRWAYYFILIKNIKEIIDDCEAELKIVKQGYSELEHFLPEHKCIKEAKVFGMTTSGAVKHKDTVLLTKPKLMIVEEAAHVLEAFVVTSLTEHCQQMILIGDHKQLRPLTGDYNLAIDYKFDISLMERLVKNGIDQGNRNWTQLKVQHRMRPEIARMVCPAIYKELHNHSDVHNYPNVKGCSKNLFFVDHRNSEGKDGGSNSYFNTYEAEFLSGFAKYLLSEGFYKPSQITIIATYLAQSLLIEKILRSDDVDECSRVRVSTVDCYQGEENDIILLSLVRNNNRGDVGFLATDNRVCVALSRARHGLFIMGDMPSLKSRSYTWATINAALVEMDCIGTRLPLVDEDLNNGEEKAGEEIQIENLISSDYQNPVNGEDFEIGIEARKSEMFLSRFDGRRVKLSDKSMDESLGVAHNNVGRERKMNILKDVSNKSVNKLLPCGHQVEIDGKEDMENIVCKKERIVFIIPCGHQKIVTCNSNSECDVNCTAMIDKELQCGHKKAISCRESKSRVKCNELIDFGLPCGHRLKIPCNEQRLSRPKCDSMVVKNLGCVHRKKEISCEEYQKGEVICDIIVEKSLPCGHKMKVPCGEDASKIKCPELKRKTFECGHEYPQKLPCHLLNEANCSFCALKRLPLGLGRGRGIGLRPFADIAIGIKICNHKMNAEKNSEISTDACTLQCDKILKCGHRCRFSCHESYDSEHLKYRCFEKCKRSCCHGCSCPGDHMCFSNCPVESNCYSEDTKTHFLTCRNKGSDVVCDMMTSLKVA